ncbi:hypothetical protein Droror1_Dr00006424 [Drosera rotundifolia]
MATVDSVSPASDPISLVKENLKPMNGRMKELQESRAELMNRLQSLKQDWYNWKSKLDAQVKIYRDMSAPFLSYLLVTRNALLSSAQQ